MLDNIKIIYNRSSIELKAAFWYMFCNVIQKMIVFLCTPFYTRALTTTQYGQYTLYQSWYSILLVFCTMNIFYSGYTIGLTKFQDKKNSYTSSTLSLVIILTAVISLLVLVSDSLLGFIRIDKKYTILVFFEIVSFAIFNIYTSYNRFYNNYRDVIVVSILMTGAVSICSIVSIIVLPTEQHLDARIYSEVIVWIVIGIICASQIIKRSRVLFDKLFWKFNLRNNIPLIPHYLSASILNQSDRLMISMFIDVESAGIYGLAYSTSMFLTAVSSAVQSAFNPYFFKQIKAGNIRTASKIIKTIIVLMTLMCMIVMLMAPEIIRVIAPKAYWDAELAMPPIIGSIFFLYLNGLFSSIEHYYGKTMSIMFTSCVCAAINILLNYLFIPRFGYYAAGYTTLACYVLQTSIHLAISHRLLKEHKLDYCYSIHMIVAVAIINIVFSMIVSISYEFTLIRLLILLVLFYIAFANRKKIIAMTNVIQQEGEDGDYTD